MKRVTPLILALLILTGCSLQLPWAQWEPEPVDTLLPFPETDETPQPTDAPPVLPSGPPRSRTFGLAYTPKENLHPLMDGDSANALLYGLVYEGLFALDETFSPQPQLCLNAVQDELTYTLTLRRSITFHDGTPLTARDVLYSLSLCTRTDSPYNARTQNIASYTAPDDFTVEIRLHTPHDRFTALLTFPIVPEQSAGLPIVPGTGPFVLEAAFSAEGENGEDEQAVLYLEQNSGWWKRTAIPVSRIEMFPADGPEALIHAFEDGRASLTDTDPTGTGALSFRGDFEIWPYPTSVLQYIGLNGDNVFLRDPAVRAALACAIDRASLLDTIYDGRADAAMLPVPPASPLYKEALARQYAYAPEKASLALLQAGYEDLDEDGVLETDIGRSREPFVLDMLVGAENDARRQAAAFAADGLSGLGVAVTVRELPYDEFIAEIAAGRFDLFYAEARLSADFSLLSFTTGGLSFPGMAAAAPEDGAPLDLASFMDSSPIIPLLFKQRTLLTRRGQVSDPVPLWESMFFYLSDWKISLG